MLSIGILRGLRSSSEFLDYCPISVVKSYNECKEVIKQLFKAKKTMLTSRELSLPLQALAQSIPDIFSNTSLPNQTSSILSNFILHLIDIFVLCDVLTSNCTCRYMPLALILLLPCQLLVCAPTLQTIRCFVFAHLV